MSKWVFHRFIHSPFCPTVLKPQQSVEIPLYSLISSRSTAITVFIVQTITTRQGNQGNNNQTTNHQTTSSQFKTTTTSSTKLIANEYFLDQGKNFTSNCPVTDSTMVTFWYKEAPADLMLLPSTKDRQRMLGETSTEIVDHTIHWDKQVR